MSADAHAEGHDDHGPAEYTYHPYPIRLGATPLGLVVFLASEIGLFGAFFLWYGHSRLLNQHGHPWPTGFDLPANNTSINTAILIASSFTCEMALIGLFRKSRPMLKWWLVATFLLGATFLGLQAREYHSLGVTPKTNAQTTIFFSLTGLHGAHVFLGLTLLLMCIIRAFRGHFSSEKGKFTGLLVTSIYWHFVDIVWIILYTVVYLTPTHVH